MTAPPLPLFPRNTLGNKLKKKFQKDPLIRRKNKIKIEENENDQYITKARTLNNLQPQITNPPQVTNKARKSISEMENIPNDGTMVENFQELLNITKRKSVKENPLLIENESNEIGEFFTDSNLIKPSNENEDHQLNHKTNHLNHLNHIMNDSLSSLNITNTIDGLNTLDETDATIDTLNSTSNIFNSTLDINDMNESNRLDSDLDRNDNLIRHKRFSKNINLENKFPQKNLIPKKDSIKMPQLNSINDNVKNYYENFQVRDDKINGNRNSNELLNFDLPKTKPMLKRTEIKNLKINNRKIQEINSIENLEEKKIQVKNEEKISEKKFVDKLEENKSKEHKTREIKDFIKEVNKFNKIEENKIDEKKNQTKKLSRTEKLQTTRTILDLPKNLNADKEHVTIPPLAIPELKLGLKIQNNNYEVKNDIESPLDSDEIQFEKTKIQLSVINEDQSPRTGFQISRNDNSDAMSVSSTSSIEAFEEEAVDFNEENLKVFLSSIDRIGSISDIGSLYTHFQLATPYTLFSEMRFREIVSQVEKYLRQNENSFRRLEIVYSDSWILDAFDILDSDESSLITLECVFIVVCLMIGRHKYILQSVWEHCFPLLWDHLKDDTSDTKIDISKARSIARLSRVDDWIVTEYIWRLNWFQYYNQQMMNNEPFIERDMFYQLYNIIFEKVDQQQEFDHMQIALSLYNQCKSRLEPNNIPSKDIQPNFKRRPSSASNSRRSSINISFQQAKSFIFPKRKSVLIPESELTNYSDNNLGKIYQYNEPINNSIDSTEEVFTPFNETNETESQNVDNLQGKNINSLQEEEIENKSFCCSCNIL